MNKTHAILAGFVCLSLVACDAGNRSGSNSADDFAARINGGKPIAQKVEPTDAPTVAAPLPGAVTQPVATPGAQQETYVPGTMADPQSSICAANAMGPFIDKLADDATRKAILEAASGAGSVRFVLPGSAIVQPDPTSTRLSIMIDNLNIIRDARCG